MESRTRFTYGASPVLFLLQEPRVAVGGPLVYSFPHVACVLTAMRHIHCAVSRGRLASRSRSPIKYGRHAA